MFFHADIKGDDLPPGTVCLTYDDGPGETVGDGPGPRTAELGAYLTDRGIAATFFVIGRHAEWHREVLGRLRNGGHLIGNHTYSHPGLVSLALAGGDVIGEIARTDAILASDADPDIRFFRAPYGNWRETDLSAGGADKPTSVVADILNRDRRLRPYVGPVNWDISGEDYDLWRRGLSAEACADAYLEQIRRVGRGIILMHDSSEDEEIRSRNRTFQATRLIVSALEAEGYRFVRLDAIPQARSAVAASRLAAADSRFRLSVTVRGDKDGIENWRGATARPRIAQYGSNADATTLAHTNVPAVATGGCDRALAQAPARPARPAAGGRMGEVGRLTAGGGHGDPTAGRGEADRPGPAVEVQEAVIPRPVS